MAVHKPPSQQTYEEKLINLAVARAAKRKRKPKAGKRRLLPTRVQKKRKLRKIPKRKRRRPVTQRKYYLKRTTIVPAKPRKRYKPTDISDYFGNWKQ